MKFFSILIAALALSAAPTQAQDNQSDSAAPSAMAKAADQVRFLTERKPATDAAYYMYVNSAYWCAPCRRTIPLIIAEYEEMRKDNHMEVILLDHDHSEKGALWYIELCSIPFPAVMYNSEERTKLPGAGFKVEGIPYIVIVDAQGNEVHSGHASTFKNWREYTKKTN